MKNTLKTILLLFLLSVAFTKPAFAGPDDFIGEVTVFAGNFAPRNHAFCEGQILKISGNEALYSLLGNKYGGDGRTSFALPNLAEAEKALNGARYIIALQGIYPARN